MTDKYAVIGNPVGHSKSPLIHRMFAEQTGLDISYEAIEAPLPGFAATIERLRNEGYRGCNVTVPFKFDAFQLADVLSERARSARAVNTLTLEGGSVRGDNTDGAGLVRDIEQNLGVSLRGKRVLLMGAGGAGLTAAISAAQTGAKVILIEKGSVIGGNTMMAGAAYNAVADKRSWADMLRFFERVLVDCI